jgi:cold shock CspA family protein
MPTALDGKMIGTVVSFNPTYKYGFIRPEGATDDSTDRFLHYSQVIDGTPITALKAGIQVAFNINNVTENTRGPVAVNVELFKAA